MKFVCLAHIHIVTLMSFHEFFVRLIFLNNKKDPSIIWLPDNLEKYLISDTYKKTFSNMKFKFFSTNKNLIFLNCNYLSHPNNRWLVANKKNIYQMSTQT